MEKIGIALCIAAPVMAMIIFIVGMVKAWPYRKTDRESFILTYRPYRWWGRIVWIAFTLIGILMIALN